MHRLQQTYKHKHLILSYLVHQAGYASQIGGNYATSCQLEGITAMKTRQIQYNLKIENGMKTHGISSTANKGYFKKKSGHRTTQRLLHNLT